MAKDKETLETRQADREFPACPPALENGKHFTYPAGKANRTPHHAAVFAATRWTNLFFPARAIVFGDLIGGRLTPVFGKGIKDVSVRTKRRGGFLSHTLYWKLLAKGDNIEKLRLALDLADERGKVNE